MIMKLCVRVFANHSSVPSSGTEVRQEQEDELR